MSDLARSQGSFLVALNTVRTAMEIADAVACFCDAAILRAISEKHSDGRWIVNERSGGMTEVSRELGGYYSDGTMRLVAALCFVKAAEAAAAAAAVRL